MDATLSLKEAMNRMESTVWAGYAASAWALVFAAMSFYWAAGGTVGASTIGAFALSRNPTFVAILWVTGLLKAFGGVLALGLVRPWGRSVSRWLLLVPAWCLGAGLLLYGGVNLVQHGLMATGIISIPTAIGSMMAVRWHLLLWDPWWLLGGIVFCLATWNYQRRTRHRRDEAFLSTVTARDDQPGTRDSEKRTDD